MNLLTTDSILASIDGRARSRLDALEVFSELESTNTYLLGEPCPPPGRFRVVLAEHQTGGRGRMQRSWVSPPLSGLCMSTAFTFVRQPDEFASLSLVVGIAIAAALERLGIQGIGLKWPNDLVLRDGKLGGILPEVHPAKTQGVTVVVGTGINVDLRHDRAALDITSSLGRAVDLASCCSELPARAEIAAALVESLIDRITQFEADGFASFHQAWREYDWLRGRAVTIEGAAANSAGIADGVDTDGALLLSAEGTTRRITSGSVVLVRPPGIPA